MLRIHFSNATDHLIALLLARLTDAPPALFAPEHLIVPHAGLRRHLEMRIADQFGIAAQLAFSYPAQWIWQQVARIVPGAQNESPYAANIMTWRVLDWLDREGPQRSPRLAAYLERSDALMRFELAERIATNLEQLVIYRPDWLASWSQGRPVVLPGATAAQREDETWLANVWRHVLHATGGSIEHPAHLLLREVAAAGRHGLDRLGLPARVAIVGLSELPPLYLEVFAGLAQVIDVDFYVFNPCQEYWYDIVSERQRARLAAAGKHQVQEVGNALLAHWGQQSRAFIEMLVERDDAEVIEAWKPNVADSLLGRVQQSILYLDAIQPGSLIADRSIQIHACHGLMRQVEVLHDQLLALFADHADLQPAEVLVVTPSLDDAAPAIEAVFGTISPGDSRHIPWRITGHATTAQAPLTRALFALLEVAQSRFESSALFDLLQQEAIARRLRLAAEDLDDIHRWMRESGMRWGLDAHHRATVGLPEATRHTLDHGFRQLFLGVAMPLPEGAVFAGTLPYADIEGQRAHTLGIFRMFVDRLDALAQRLTVDRTVTEWTTLLLDLLDEFLEPDRTDLTELVGLRAAIAELARTSAAGDGTRQSLPVAVIEHLLEKQLASTAPGGIPGGAVTFTAMTPLRQLPYRVICTLALDHGSFPGDAHADEFDLLTAFGRKGDRQRRRDDRNVFLDLLLAANDHFLVLYTGRNQRDNSTAPPSVVVAELVDLLVDGLCAPEASGTERDQMRTTLVVEHPLQAHSKRYFQGSDSSLFSFNRELADALSVRQTTSTSSARPRFFDHALPPAGAEWLSLDLRDLMRFLGNPAAWLLGERLRISLHERDETLADSEPFELDPADRWTLDDRILAMFEAEYDVDTVRAAALLLNEVPDGVAGELEVAPRIERARRFHERRVALQRGEPLPRYGFSWTCEAMTLSGELTGLSTAGMLCSRLGDASARTLLDTWVQHLALCCAGPPTVPRCTQWLGVDDQDTFHFVDDGQAASHLSDLLSLYCAGLERPLPFFPRSAAAFAGKGDLAVAQREWYSEGEHARPESAHPAYQMVWGATGAGALNAEFEILAQRVFVPLLANFRKGCHEHFL